MYLRIHVTLWRVRVNNIAVEKHYDIFCVCVCSFNYPACRAQALYYIVICVLSGSTEFFQIIS
jgi:hypothetical protein